MNKKGRHDLILNKDLSSKLHFMKKEIQLPGWQLKWHTKLYNVTANHSDERKPTKGCPLANTFKINKMLCPTLRSPFQNRAGRHANGHLCVRGCSGLTRGAWCRGSIQCVMKSGSGARFPRIPSTWARRASLPPRHSAAPHSSIKAN